MTVGYLVYQCSDGRDDPAAGTLVMVVNADSPEAAIVAYNNAVAGMTNFDRRAYAEPEATPLAVGALYCV